MAELRTATATSVPYSSSSCPIGSGNLLPQALGAGGLEDDLACFGSALGKDIHASFIEPVQKLMQLVPCSGRGERVAVCLGRQGKTIWNSDALLRKSGIKLPERSVLAANDRNIAEMNIAKPTNIALGDHRVDVLEVETLVHTAADLLICLKGGPQIGQGADLFCSCCRFDLGQYGEIRVSLK